MIILINTSWIDIYIYFPHVQQYKVLSTDCFLFKRSPAWLFFHLTSPFMITMCSALMGDIDQTEAGLVVNDLGGDDQHIQEEQEKGKAAGEGVDPFRMVKTKTNGGV